MEIEINWQSKEEAHRLDAGDNTKSYAHGALTKIKHIIEFVV